MIKFAELVQAIHKSINDAAKSVEADGIRHINKFFDRVEEEDAKDDPTLMAGTSKPVPAEKLFSDFELDGKYRPKMVSMEFPKRTPNGIETTTVDVPLIVLSPISTPKVTQAKFTADLQVNADEEGNLEIDFPKNNHSFFNRKGDENRGNTQIEITIEAAESPDGLKKVIEGYERALRAQIPG
jgi:hypothetical protein